MELSLTHDLIGRNWEGFWGTLFVFAVQNGFGSKPARGSQAVAHRGDSNKVDRARPIQSASSAFSNCRADEAGLAGANCFARGATRPDSSAPAFPILKAVLMRA